MRVFVIRAAASTSTPIWSWTALSLAKIGRDGRDSSPLHVVCDSSSTTRARSGSTHLFDAVPEQARDEVVLLSLHQFEWIIGESSNPGPLFLLPHGIREVHVESYLNIIGRFSRWLEANIYPLRRLKKLELPVGDIIRDRISVLGDGDIHAMADAWPKIQVLGTDVHGRWLGRHYKH
ncbi:hypothetical protein OBBRIDRAFT_193848 [Obba rivulosa]|uniref:Uncharacterized protein n=1 Tax=Obba rivulosa TaxID=1052685 RepID=A0A8E2ALL2_9APHY|nr:hypothetical protein OBBRIDRAFT_193848 [Obba rivulosa]